MVTMRIMYRNVRLVTVCKGHTIIEIVISILEHPVLSSDITNDLTFGYPYYTSSYVPFLSGRRFIQISHDSSQLALT